LNVAYSDSAPCSIHFLILITYPCSGWLGNYKVAAE
jgi:hypothetical protein